MLLLQLSELKYMSKGRGLIMMGLEKGEKLVAVVVSDRPAPDRSRGSRVDARRK